MDDVVGLPASVTTATTTWPVRLIQTGKLQEVPYRDGVWETAIYKQARLDPVTVNRVGIEGDMHTGGGPDPERAICLHAARHYSFWEAYFRTRFPLGTFGENLTIDGMAEEDLCIGDILRCGSVIMQVSQPRMPCFKQARRIDQADFVKLILQTCRTGFLTRILETGTMQVGDPLELIERPLPEVPLLFVLQTLQRRHPEDAATLAAQPLLANEWRERFALTNDQPTTRNSE